MAKLNIIEEVERVANEGFSEEGLEGCYLLDINLHGKKLEVFVDTDEGVKFWQCQKLSRVIEAYLDESQALGEEYTIEVSSPGIDKPLQLQRQYPRNIGRKLQVTLKREQKAEETDQDSSSQQKEILEGKLLEVNENDLLLKVQGAKKGMFKEKTILFEDIAQTIVMVSFSKKKK